MSKQIEAANKAIKTLRDKTGHVSLDEAYNMVSDAEDAVKAADNKHGSDDPRIKSLIKEFVEAADEFERYAGG